MDEETIRLNKRAISVAIKMVKNAYSADKILMQAVDALNEEEHLINVEYERLKELYWRYYPEKVVKINSINELINSVLNDERPNNSMGYDISEDEIKFIKDFAVEIKNHLSVIKIIENFIKKQAKLIAPRTCEIAGAILTAKLIRLANGIKKMALMPSSTIQLLGAEKALFRHLRSGSKPPKYGVLLFHPKVQSSINKGKTARQLANKIAITIKEDYFNEQLNKD